MNKDDDTWEPLENVVIDPILLENFYKNQLAKEKRAEIRIQKKNSNKSLPP